MEMLIVCGLAVAAGVAGAAWVDAWSTARVCRRQPERRRSWGIVGWAEHRAARRRPRLACSLWRAGMLH